MQNHASLRGTGSSSWFPDGGVAGVRTCSLAAGGPALPALGADQVVQRLMEKNKERADTLQHY
jgi:hypothetical protein